MKPLSLPLVPFLFVFVLGVHAAFQTTTFYLCIEIAIASYLLIYYSFFSPLKWQTVLWGICFFLLGFYMAKFDQRIPKDHYSFSINQKIENSFEVELHQRLYATSSKDRFYVKLVKLNGKAASGVFLLNVEKKGEKKALDQNKRWIIKGQLHPIQPPLNPGAFDYKNYLLGHDIYHQFNSHSDSIIAGKNSDFSFYKYQAFLSQKIKQSGLDPKAASLLQAMLLGKRSMLDTSTRERFSKAGVIHLFAISGLHIGLLMLFFQTLLRPLQFLAGGKAWQSLGVVVCLWGYAFLVGASPSVLRAVTLFSAYQIGRSSRRKLPTAYMVLLSMGLLLFIHPRFILQLGFQMSYLAVFGILFIKPLLHCKFNLKLLQWFWELTTVSLAAQIAVAPLSIFHFHQFPGLFLLSNWVILPFVGLFLYLGIGSLGLLLFMPLPVWMQFLINKAVELMLEFVEWIAAKEAFLFTDLYLDTGSLILLYCCLFSLVSYRRTFKIIWLLASFVGGLGLYENLSQSTSPQLWIAHRYKQSVIVVNEREQVRFFHSDSLSPQGNFVADYAAFFKKRKKIFHSLKNTYTIHGKSLVIIDEEWIFDLKPLPLDYWLLHKNVKINLTRLLEKGKPKKVIIDGSNSPYYINQWITTLSNAWVAYHLTGKKGALYLNHENEE